MKTVDLDPETAEHALVVLARHIPLHVEIGRPLLAQRLDADSVLIVADAQGGPLGWTVRAGEVEQALTDEGQSVHGEQARSTLQPQSKRSIRWLF